MPFQQVTGASLPQQAAWAYLKPPPLAWRKPWLLPWEGSSRHAPKYCPQILTIGSKPALHPPQARAPCILAILTTGPQRQLNSMISQPVLPKCLYPLQHPGPLLWDIPPPLCVCRGFSKLLKKAWQLHCPAGSLLFMCMNTTEVVLFCPLLLSMRCLLFTAS